jgi:hypothetical protein
VKQKLVYRRIRNSKLNFYFSFFCTFLWSDFPVGIAPESVSTSSLQINMDVDDHFPCDSDGKLMGVSLQEENGMFRVSDCIMCSILFCFVGYLGLVWFGLVSYSYLFVF